MSLGFHLRRMMPRLRFAPYRERLGPPAEDLARQRLLPQLVADALSEQTLRLNLFYAWMLEQLELPRLAHARVLDLGSKDFSYAPGLSLALSAWYERFELTGLELDPYRLFTSFYRRGDCARYYVEQASRAIPPGCAVRYETGDWLTRSPAEYELITCFFPFIYEDLHKRFGLPRSGFSPQRFYEKCLTESSRVIFFHQGEEERDDSLKLLEELGCRPQARGPFFKNPWMKRKFPVYAIVAARSPATP